MAKKIDGNKEDQGAAELDTLLPYRKITIAGEKLTVREYTLFDSLMLHEQLEPVIASLAGVMVAPSVELSAVQSVLAKHADLVPALVAWSIDRPAGWVKNLRGQDGQVLLDWWWGLNGDFFISAAQREIYLRQRVAAQSDLGASSQS